jgi:hypothetical protein
MHAGGSGISAQCAVPVHEMQARGVQAEFGARHLLPRPGVHVVPGVLRELLKPQPRTNKSAITGFYFQSAVTRTRARALYYRPTACHTSTHVESGKFNGKLRCQLPPRARAISISRRMYQRACRAPGGSVVHGGVAMSEYAAMCRLADSGSSYAPCESTSSTSMFAIRHPAAVSLLSRCPSSNRFVKLSNSRVMVAMRGLADRDVVPCTPIGRIPAALKLSTTSQLRLGEAELTCSACYRHSGAGCIPVCLGPRPGG